MKATFVILKTCARPSANKPIPELHAEVTSAMRNIGAPLGWKDLAVPPAPDCGGDLSASFEIRYPIPGLEVGGHYAYRDKMHLSDDKAWLDDFLEYIFKNNNKHLDYRAILRVHFPQVIQAFKSYRANVAFGVYATKYSGGINDENPIYRRLLADPAIDVDGRNNIFTLEPAMYWDALLCKRALGYDRDEVIRRLEGKVPMVMPLMDGVYTVFNDDPDLSYEAFIAINDTFKPILGLE